MELTFGPDDVVVVAVKSQDTAGVVDALAAVAGPATPIVSLQNGVTNEVAFLRRFADVHGVTVMAPTWHLEPGVVRAYTHDAAAILDIGAGRAASTASRRPSPRRSGMPGSSPWPATTSLGGSTRSCCST